MLNFQQKKKKLKFQKSILSKIKHILGRLLRLKDVMMMMILLHFSPAHVYKFSTRKFLPNKSNKFSKNSRPKYPFKLIKSKSSKIKFMEEINVVGLGSSFDYNKLKKMKGPIFLAPCWVPLKIDENNNIINPYENLEAKRLAKKFSNVTHSYDNTNSKHLKEFKKKNLIYINNRHKYIERLVQTNHNVISIYLHHENANGDYENLHKKEPPFAKTKFSKKKNYKKISIVDNIFFPPLPDNFQKFAPTGSFLPILIALSYFAKKVNVYGWDFYLNTSPDKMTYFELLRNMYKYDADINRSRNHFEGCLINFYYGYSLSKLKKFKIHSNMGKLDKHKNLIKRIEKVLFN